MASRRMTWNVVRGSSGCRPAAGLLPPRTVLLLKAHAMKTVLYPVALHDDDAANRGVRLPARRPPAGVRYPALGLRATRLGRGPTRRCSIPHTQLGRSKPNTLCPRGWRPASQPRARPSAFNRGPSRGAESRMRRGGAHLPAVPSRGVMRASSCAGLRSTFARRRMSGCSSAMP
jgi:hypothetical protein